ncbi:DNA mismatch repair endonuclease MutL [Pseudofulvibacter geojedonensis]|uniref:DNA mismatch repair protein MutL n=1 Tax=Pseudofulvibacter geojedonensis TaxID=1123758 RepID=A0ABW3I3N0_9FLAO
MSDIIQLLPDHVANQIAAGEVVQRPASVVKELLENAIDAKATRIQLLVKDAGKTLVQVIDNGFGMSVTDARLSFERHATSKIASAEDLFQLNTKGFRGEALASIAAIAHVEMKTKREADELGTLLKIEGSEVTAQEPIVTPVGTSIAVKNLFFNIPARRNFLKSDQVEMRHVIDEFQRVALAHPSITFTLHHNGNTLFNLPNANYRQRIVGVLGSKANEKLVPVNEETEIVKISGFVLKPEFAKKSRGEQFIFVNDRYIKNSYLNHAITAAFEGLLRERTHPGYFLFLEVDPKTIDINIHPTKTEIKFDNEHDLYAIIKSTVKHSLGQFQIAPILDFQRDPNLDTPYSYQSKNIGTPTIEVDSNFNPFANEKPKGTSSSGNYGGSSYSKKSTEGWESLYVGLESKMTGNLEQSNIVEVESEEVTGSFFEDKEVTQNHITLQIQNKYIISKIKSGMMVINQGRAHERILFEEFLQHITINEAVSQQLLFPVTLSVSPQELSLLSTIREVLESTGFIFSKLEDETVEISGVPAAIGNQEVGIIISDLLTAVVNETEIENELHTHIVAKSLAKSLAIKSGKALSTAEQEDLVNRLFACKEPTISPTNKSVFITYNTTDFDKKLL